MFEFITNYLNPSVQKQMEQELKDAQIQLLAAENLREHWDAETRKLKMRVQRLTASVKENNHG